MDIRILKSDEMKRYEPQLFSLLSAADDEFVPPLSTRFSTTQKSLAGGEKSKDGIRAYFDQMKTQSIMVAEEDGQVYGFVSFKENYVNDQITNAHLPNIYLSTLVVSPAARGKGLTKQIYATLFAHYADRFVCTRTWSTNAAHIRILDHFGFTTLCTIPNDRGTGIDTVYFIKRK